MTTTWKGVGSVSWLASEGPDDATQTRRMLTPGGMKPDPWEMEMGGSHIGKFLSYLDNAKVWATFISLSWESHVLPKYIL